MSLIFKEAIFICRLFEDIVEEGAELDSEITVEENRRHRIISIDIPKTVLLMVALFQLNITFSSYFNK